MDQDLDNDQDNNLESKDGQEDNLVQEKQAVVHDELSLFLEAVNLGHLYETLKRNEFSFSNIFCSTKSDLLELGINHCDVVKLLDEIKKLMALMSDPVPESKDEEPKISRIQEIELIVSSYSQHLLFLSASIEHLNNVLKSDSEILEKNIFQEVKNRNILKSLNSFTQSVQDLKKQLSS